MSSTSAIGSDYCLPGESWLLKPRKAAAASESDVLATSQDSEGPHASRAHLEAFRAHLANPEAEGCDLLLSSVEHFVRHSPGFMEAVTNSCARIFKKELEDLRVQFLLECEKRERHGTDLARVEEVVRHMHQGDVRATSQASSEMSQQLGHSDDKHLPVDEDLFGPLNSKVETLRSAVEFLSAAAEDTFKLAWEARVVQQRQASDFATLMEKLSAKGLVTPTLNESSTVLAPGEPSTDLKCGKPDGLRQPQSPSQQAKDSTACSEEEHPQPRSFSAVIPSRRSTEVRGLVHGGGSAARLRSIEAEHAAGLQQTRSLIAACAERLKGLEKDVPQVQTQIRLSTPTRDWAQPEKLEQQKVEPIIKTLVEEKATNPELAKVQSWTSPGTLDRHASLPQLQTTEPLCPQPATAGPPPSSSNSFGSEQVLSAAPPRVRKSLPVSPWTRTPRVVSPGPIQRAVSPLPSMWPSPPASLQVPNGRMMSPPSAKRDGRTMPHCKQATPTPSRMHVAGRHSSPADTDTETQQQQQQQQPQPPQQPQQRCSAFSPTPDERRRGMPSPFPTVSPRPALGLGQAPRRLRPSAFPFCQSNAGLGSTGTLGGS